MLCFQGLQGFFLVSFFFSGAFLVTLPFQGGQNKASGARVEIGQKKAKKSNFSWPS